MHAAFDLQLAKGARQAPAGTAEPKNKESCLKEGILLKRMHLLTTYKKVIYDIGAEILMLAVKRP